jgi:hypothetical protein
MNNLPGVQHPSRALDLREHIGQQQPQPEDWMKGLAKKANTPESKRSDLLNRLICKHLAPPEEVAWQSLIDECMQLGETEVLRAIQENVRMSTLHIGRPDMCFDQRAWTTLEDATPDGFAAGMLVLSGIVDDSASEALPKVVMKMPELTTLSLEGVTLTYRWMLGRELARHGGLCSLRLRDVNVENNSMYLFLEDILDSMKLDGLELSAGSQIDPLGHRSMTGLLARQKNLTALRLNRWVDSASVSAYTTFLKRNSTLVVLDLASNDIDPMNCNLLIDSLKGNTTLDTLSLRNCNIISSDVWPVQLGQLPCLGLRNLDLGHNPNLGESALLPMLEALQGNTRLQRLDLSGTNVNRETTAFVQVLAESLTHNQTLTHLCLPTLSPDELRILTPAVLKNSSLCYVNLFEPARDGSEDGATTREILRGRRAFREGSMGALLDHFFSDVGLLPWDMVLYATEVAYQRDRAAVDSLAFLNHEALQRAKDTQTAYLADQAKHRKNG